MSRPVAAVAAAVASRLSSRGFIVQVREGVPLAGPSPGSNLRHSPFASIGWRFVRHFSGVDDGVGSNAPGEAGNSADEKPVRRKKLSKKERFGRYDEEFDDEMAQVPIDEAIEHLYDARPIFEEWMGHPTFYDMISADAYPRKGAPKHEPPGEGPILRWQTRVVLSPGGEAFHPKNRKVKVSVYVKELELTPTQRERLLFMVGKRYNPNMDELTIVSERYDQREENRKDVLRMLISLIEEAKKEEKEEVGAITT